MGCTFAKRPIMQSIAWYYSRLTSMSPAEIAWRLKGPVRDVCDRVLLGWRRRPRELAEVVSGNGDGRCGLDLASVAGGEWASIDATGAGFEESWRGELLACADAIAAGRLSFFDLEDRYLGDPIDWHRDHKRDRPTPRGFAAKIDYRDVEEAGDCKYVWEPNRHHQLVVLGRAYRVSGDARYAEAVVEQLGSWLEQNPFGMGMNWRSPLELGVRLINWVWALGLIADSGLVEGEFHRRLVDSIDRHIWDIDRKYSKGSSSNNHVVGEAAGAFIAASHFAFLKRAARWRARARRVLMESTARLIHADGGLREQAVGYHLFVLQFALIAGLVGRWTDDDFPVEYWDRLEKMFEYLGVLSEGGDALPMFGDADDGYVLDLGEAPRDPRQWLAVGAVLFDRADMKRWAGGYSQTAWWLLGEDGRRRYEALEAPSGDVEIVSRSFAETGQYLLQSGRADSEDRISVVFDCGEHGYESIAAHAHADALSFTLRAFGRDVLVDPGTYDYFSCRRWRDYFRSTRAHNTIVIDGLDQSEMLGPFLWGRRAKTTCLAWEPSQRGGKVTGQHDGYKHLSDPVIHRRTLELDGLDRTLVIRDEILATGRHDVEVCFHFAEHCRATPEGENHYSIDVGPGVVEMDLDGRLSVAAVRGGEDPIGGWVSRGYHRKTASTTLIGRCVSSGQVSLICRMDMSEPIEWRGIQGNGDHG